MKARTKWFFVALLMGGLTGCMPAVRYQIQVDSLTSPAAQTAKSYILFPGNEGVTKDDLQYQEYAAQVSRVLASHDFVPAPIPSKADVAIALTYGIGDPKTQQYSYSLPIFGQTGVASSTTYGTASTYGGQTTYTGTTSYTPSYGVTGSSQQTVSVTQYSRFIELTAYDLKIFQISNKQVELWKTTIASTGTSGDLRRVFPAMIAAASPYLATNTGKQVEVTLKESDPAIQLVRGGP